MNKNIKLLNDAGQSIWYDNLSKDILSNGTLASLIQEGLSGLTSNPAIFEQSIAKTTTYLAEISELKKQGKNAIDICDRLMLNDVANAADLLLPTYQATSGKDGYASLEVSPLLANNILETIVAAKLFWKELNRPNIMIKIPATPAGISAIQDLIAFGININVTLIFSPIVYKNVINSYLAGLKTRLEQGKDISRIHSVASFFISRADTWFENQLPNKPELGQLVGKVGIANGLKAYEVFAENFSSNEFLKLQESGANIQKILWASTGVKNKSLDSLLYVKELPYNNSVATHPPALIEAILKAENFSLVTSEIKFEDVFQTLSDHNLSLEKMYQDLLKEGVDKFADSFNQLLQVIEKAG